MWVTISRLIAKIKQAAIAALISSGIQAEERCLIEAELSIQEGPEQGFWQKCGNDRAFFFGWVRK